MFSTILDKVTGYFDKRTLISAFFPSLVFWGLVVVAFIGFQIQWSVAVHAWDGLSGTIQFLLLFAFLVWVAFWSFLIVNFRTTFTRIFEGYWPTNFILGHLFRWRQKYWQDRWALLDDADNTLASREGPLRGEQYAYKQLQTLLSSSSPPQQKGEAPDAEIIGQELEVFLKDVETKIFSSSNQITAPETLILSVEDLEGIGQQTRIWWKKFLPWRDEAQENQQSPWSERLNRLEKITVILTKMVDQQVEQIEAKRQPLYRDLSLYYPPSPGDIMPTRLGNILKAAELYAWTRYRLDYTVIWPRLQPSLAGTFSSILENAQTSFDLMVTFCASLFFFGIPLSCWAAIKSTSLLPWWAMLLLTLAALPFRLYVPAAFAALGLFLSLPLFTYSHWTIHVQLLIGLLVILFFLYWLSYQSAIQAALNYGEQIKAAFDLYRWEVLKNLHLQFPKDFTEERKVWTEVGGLLLRSYTPDERYYRFVEEKDKDSSDTQRKGQE